jgi:hypothetical protein
VRGTHIEGIGEASLLAQPQPGALTTDALGEGGRARLAG